MYNTAYAQEFIGQTSKLILVHNETVWTATHQPNKRIIKQKQQQHSKINTTQKYQVRSKDHRWLPAK